MFYSQFILAKKGPLGTIWIAAHLERKLRKNQVADTDIGVSVDSILSPDVPIALRLSSHLLLGVVRIYNRKVNYLFDDCSEALLKVKQAFRSTAVDLPPEESKAPYHSITLPETFDLDDFELPDNDILQGNFVDRHISSREQITLQDSVEGVSYSTSKFGLDERFGDADAPGLDLDEELFLDNLGTEGHAEESMDPQASIRSMSPLKQAEHSDNEAAESEPLGVDINEEADLMDYAHAPCTPGLVEEPNFSNVQEASACDDHLEMDYHSASTMKENTKYMPYEDRQEVDWCSRDDTVSNLVPELLPEENVHQTVVLEIKESKPQGQSPIEANIEFAPLKESPLVSKQGVDLSGPVQAMNTASELDDNIIETPDVPCREDLQNGPIKEDENYLLSVGEARDDHQGPNEIVVEKIPETFGLSEDVSVSPLAVEVSANLGQKPCPDASEVALENHVGSSRENSKTQYCHDTTDSSALNLDSHENDASIRTLRACNSTMEQFDPTKSWNNMSANVDMQSDIAVLASSGGEETTTLGGICMTGNSDFFLKANEPASAVHYHSVSSESDGLLNSTNSKNNVIENLSNSVEAELPAPEKLLAVPEGNVDQRSNMLLEVSPINFDGLDKGEIGSNTIAGKKRNFTEITPTEQSLNSVESSRLVRFKSTTESVPYDNDLLSSILVGRNSSIFKVKTTPEAASMKRIRSAPRSGAPKRKLVMDETMVLHGDKIRQQLTNTEDIRRVRKKAPCTRSEISMIRKQHLEDEIFLEPVFTGMSTELSSLHNQVYDLSRITVCLNDVTCPIELTAEPRLASQDDEKLAAELRLASQVDENGVFLETLGEPKQPFYYEKDGAFLEAMAEPHLTSHNIGIEANHNIGSEVNHNIESGNGSDMNDIVGQSGTRPNSELLPVRDNETPEPTESLMLNETRLEEVDITVVEVNINQEQINPTNDMCFNVSQEEPLLDVVEAEKCESNVHNVSSVYIAEVESLGSFGDANGYMGDAFSYQKTNAPSPSLGFDSVNVDERQTIVRDEAAEKEDYIFGLFETELGGGDDILSAGARDGGADVVRNAEHGELKYDVQNEIYNITPEEQHHVEFAYPTQVSMLEDVSLNNGENAENSEAYHPNMMDAEFPGFDLHERNELNYSATGNDTEFLNVDDDELTEMADDYLPDDEEKQFAENTGWSSRTRAVSKYLQAAFEKEAEHGKRSLSTNNLLNGKSRKEASRMFFETLVLKTRDYIHVEQQSPYDDIILKPRAKLMKSDF